MKGVLGLLLSLAGALGLVIAFIAFGWWAIQVLGVGVTRRLPDPHPDLHRIGRVQKFSGFDRRPMLVYRQRCVAADIERLQAHKRHLDQELSPPARAVPPLIAEVRRSQAG